MQNTGENVCLRGQKGGGTPVRVLSLLLPVECTERD